MAQKIEDDPAFQAGVKRGRELEAAEIFEYSKDKIKEMAGVKRILNKFVLNEMKDQHLVKGISLMREEAILIAEKWYEKLSYGSIVKLTHNEVASWKVVTIEDIQTLKLCLQDEKT